MVLDRPSVCQDCQVGRHKQGVATRQRLVVVATRLFGESGFDAVAIPEVLDHAGVSRGALYHHFPSKEALFEAVLEDVEAHVAQELLKASGATSDPQAALQAGCRAFIRLVRTPTIRQIVLVDAPSVVGWARWREIDERHAFGLMKGAVEALASEGRIPSTSVDVVTHMLLAALMEVALLVARDHDPLSLRRGEQALKLLLERTFTPSPR